jgi:hypothetical protein
VAQRARRHGARAQVTRAAPRGVAAHVYSYCTSPPPLETFAATFAMHQFRRRIRNLKPKTT